MKGILASHVDDFIWGGTDTFSTTIIPQLKDAFQVGREEHDSFSYIGIKVHSQEDEIHVQQGTYIKNKSATHSSRLNQSNTA